MYKITPAMYTITHSYFSTMQQGIQAAHAISEIMHKYQGVDDKLNADVIDWARNHKTIKMLSGGSGLDFTHNRHVALDVCSKYSLPFAEFNEPDIGNMVTSFCFAVTEKMVYMIEDERCDVTHNSMSDEEYIGEIDNNPVVHFLKQLRSAK